MSKKSYRQIQNRLYREIKRRMLVEQTRVSLEMHPLKLYDRRIETFGCARLVRDMALEVPTIRELVKSEMAVHIARKLVAEGFVEYGEIPMPSISSVRLEARIKVVRPEQEDGNANNGLL